MSKPLATVFISVYNCELYIKQCLDRFFNSRVIRNFEKFKFICDVIVSNRLSKELNDVKEKVYTRDLLNRD